jgi:CDP-glucose 4,6-dehydratase
MENLVTPRLPDKHFWRGKKVFLTGHTGFKGGWLSLWLSELGAEVQGYALAPTTPQNLFEALRLDALIGHEIADIRNGQHLSASLQNFSPDIVIHMAAQPLVLYSYAQPVETYATNVMGTVNLLEAARSTSAAVTLIITSDKCYENHNTPRGYREDDRLGGHDPYSNSKAYATSYFSTLGLALGSARAGNVIGGGDWSPDRLMTDIIAALLANRAPVLRAPNAIRPWQHVLEPLCGYLLAIEHLFATRQAGAAWNFGPDPASEVTVAKIAEKTCQLWGAGITPIHEGDASRGKEAQLLALDSTKACMELAWQPHWSLDQALQATVQWFKAWSKGTDMREFTLNQIAGYIRITQPA